MESVGGTRHGEYKTPGGKLVVSDFAVEDGRLRDVKVSGDRFLEPRIDRVKITDKAIASAEKRVGPLKRQTGLSREEVLEAMIRTFAERNTSGGPGEGLVEDGLTGDELAEAEELVRFRYGTREWTCLIP